MLALIGAPILIVFGVTYGNEGINRVWLFAYPWLACSIALALWPEPEFEEHLPPTDWLLFRRFARRIYRHSSRSLGTLSQVGIDGAKWISALVLMVTAGLSIVLSYSQNEIYQVAPADVQAATYFYQHAPAGVAYFVDGGFPTEIGARYATFMGHGGGRYYTLELSDFPELELGDTAQLLRAVTTLACGAERPASPVAYMVLSKQQEEYAKAFGTFDTAFFDRLKEGLQQSKEWHPYFSNATTEIYRIGPGCINRRD